MTRIAVLGGGPAGLGAAYRLRRDAKADVVVLERGERVGGNAGSFVWNGHHLDFGSHRLHPASDQAVLDDVRLLLGDELLDRPRHGRIRLMGRWLHFPLKPVDLALSAPPRFLAGVARDTAFKVLPKPDVTADRENFATVLERGLGRAICEHFYFPYAVKLWGHEPAALSAIQARRRVSAGSIGKLVGKVMKAVPGLKPAGSGRFFYPRHGFGRISEAFADAARERGADLRLGTSVTGLTRRGTGGWKVRTARDGAEETLEVDHVWSTIPVTLAARMLSPAAPDEVLAATRGIDYRAMVLIYLDLPVAQFTEYDAHYFPGADLSITRLSEPSNYGLVRHPEGRTALCAELPCTRGDRFWTMSDADLGQLMADDLERAGLPLPCKPVAVHAARLPQAYPVYLTGYEKHLDLVQAHVDALPEFLSFGRQGLFAHDNTHHALYMAFCAVDCLGTDGRFDTAKWSDYRREFAQHVVED